MKPGFIVLILLLLITCSQPGEKESSSPALPEQPDTLFLTVQVNNLRLRKNPGLEEETLLMLPLDAKVQFWNEKSENSSEVNLRGKLISEKWFRVKYGSTTGWVFGGALSPVNDNVDGKGTFDYMILPGERVGPVKAGDSETVLIERLGREEVQRGEFFLSDENAIPATYLFPSSEKELILLWKEGDFNKLQEIRIRKADSPWIMASGLRVGSKLSAVTSANGGPFLIQGYDSEFAGSSQSWQGGKLPESLTVIFDEPERMHKSLRVKNAISSDDERLTRSNPTIKYIRIHF